MSTEPRPDIDGMADGRVTPPVEHQAYALLRRIVTDTEGCVTAAGPVCPARLALAGTLILTDSEAALVASLSQEGTTP